MRLLLSYSSALFDPDLPPEQQKHWGASANIISRTLYELLGPRGDVTFVDAAAPDEVSGERFDAFVGIVRNFRRILEICEVERSILVAVNMHPAEHNALLVDFVVRQKLPSASLHQLDVLDLEDHGGAIDAADEILCFGNAVTLDSYVRHGVPKEKCRLVNCSSDLTVRRPATRAPEGGDTHLLYCASEIGLRKGFDIFESAVMAASLEELGAHLHIVGAPSYPHYQAKLADLEARLGPRISNHGWLAPTSPEYREVLERADFLLFPSLEEGQAGTVIDAMSCGVIPLISAHCGVDFAPLGFCELETASEHNVQLLGRACRLPAGERMRLRDQTLEYYDEFHAGFEQQLEAALGGALLGSPRPRVSAARSSVDNDHLVPHGTPVLDERTVGEKFHEARQRARKRYLLARRQWLNATPLVQVLGEGRRRLRMLAIQSGEHRG